MKLSTVGDCCHTVATNTAVIQLRSSSTRMTAFTNSCRLVYRPNGKLPCATAIKRCLGVVTRWNGRLSKCLATALGPFLLDAGGETGREHIGWYSKGSAEIL